MVMFFRADDSMEVTRMKVFMVKILAICLFVQVILTFGFPLRNLISDNYELEHERSQAIVHLVNNSVVIFLFILCLVWLHKRGVTTGLKVVIITVPLWYSTLQWLNAYNADIFHFTILSLDVGLAMSTPQDSVLLDGLAALVLVVSTGAVSIECIDLSSNGDLGIHIWGREGSNAYLLTWCSFILPMSLNFFLLRSYVASAREQARRALLAVELAYQVADKLANYDLDAAETLLNQKDVQCFEHDVKEPLAQLLANLRTYSPFLPHSLFSDIDGTIYADNDVPNKKLRKLMDGKELAMDRVDAAILRIRQPDYTLLDFHDDMVAAYPELLLYYVDEHKTTSGLKSDEEYQRTLGALYTVYSLLRLDMDGKEVFAYGINEQGEPLREPVGDLADKKREFYQSVCWDEARELVKRAGLISQDEDGKVHVRKDRLSAMLALTAIHDIMKNTSLSPTVQPRHSPYRGYAAGEQIGDHDVALEYVLEHFPTLLPTFRALEPGQRAPIFFTQGKMGFNNGWLVQGEAPPGALFARFKQVVVEGRASQADISFYFLHWFTDLAGAEPFHDRPWPGAEKFTVKFPVKVLSAFLDSFGFVDRLSWGTEVEVMEDYLVSCWTKLGPPSRHLPPHYEVAAMRLALMAQGFEQEVVAAFTLLNEADRELLAEELARTGRKEQFQRAPASVRSSVSGPALLVYYSPALLQKAKAEHCASALSLLAAVFRSARTLFPLDGMRIEETVTIRIDELKVLNPLEVQAAAPWHLRRTSGVDAEAARGHATNKDCVLIDIYFSEAHASILHEVFPLEIPAAKVPEMPLTSFHTPRGAARGFGKL